ncbi:hypothetical protein RRG08_019146 [Elysia crispata]|uniref:Uncharacterized protein n=1 Tax=Elysia crispata TaxID=231223 RepID=A0AAE1EFA3_9GAST|nr:hypothetical protein RRG08_019146 [Elysia crispata]
MNLLVFYVHYDHHKFIHWTRVKTINNVSSSQFVNYPLNTYQRIPGGSSLSPEKVRKITGSPGERERCSSAQLSSAPLSDRLGTCPQPQQLLLAAACIRRQSENLTLKDGCSAARGCLVFLKPRDSRKARLGTGRDSSKF